MDSKEQLHDYETALLYYEVKAAQFAILEKSGFKSQFPEKYKQGINMLAKLEEKLYFWKRQLQKQATQQLMN